MGFLLELYHEVPLAPPDPYVHNTLTFICVRVQGYGIQLELALLPQHSWNSDENKAHMYELLVKTDIFYFVFVITIYFNEFCTTNKCKQ